MQVHRPTQDKSPRTVGSAVLLLATCRALAGTGVASPHSSWRGSPAKCPYSPRGCESFADTLCATRAVRSVLMITAAPAAGAGCGGGSPAERGHSVALCAVERNSRAAQSRGFLSRRSLLEVRAGLPLQRDVGVGGRLQAPASGRLSRCRSKVVIARGAKAETLARRPVGEERDVVGHRGLFIADGRPTPHLHQLIAAVPRAWQLLVSAVQNGIMESAPPRNQAWPRNQSSGSA
jgi:hypothetical protein